MYLVYAFIGGLLGLVSTFIGKALFALGFGYLVFKGFDSTMSVLLDGIINKFSSLPSEIRCIANILRFGNAVNIIASAISVRLALMGLHSDTIKKLITVTES